MDFSPLSIVSRVKPAGGVMATVSLLEHVGDRTRAGQVCYLRVRVLGYTVDFDGAKRAVVEFVDRDGKPEMDTSVLEMRVDEKLLIESKIVGQEMKG